MRLRVASLRRCCNPPMIFIWRVLFRRPMKPFAAVPGLRPDLALVGIHPPSIEGIEGVELAPNGFLSDLKLSALWPKWAMSIW